MGVGDETLKGDERGKAMLDFVHVLHLRPVSPGNQHAGFAAHEGFIETVWRCP